ncbi:hypothetical protein [Actinacidiphila acididurans]|uniref:hypothetical protein n=1 Tax=Actinacidiphila acididurans TaxID=2784346 RepID=UPI001F1A99C3|nr:hypothetical protein [Actinacidiphila acididurans]
MNRWVVERYSRLAVWISDRASRQAERRTAADRGQTSFEYLGIAVVIAVIIGVLATTGIGTAIENAIISVIGRISGGGGGGGK